MTNKSENIPQPQHPSRNNNNGWVRQTHGTSNGSIPSEGSVNSRRMGMKFTPKTFMHKHIHDRKFREYKYPGDSSALPKSRPVSERELQNFISQKSKVPIVPQAKQQYVAHKSSRVGQTTASGTRWSSSSRKKQSSCSNEDLKLVKSTNVSRKRDRSTESYNSASSQLRQGKNLRRDLYQSTCFNTIKHPKSKYSPLKVSEIKFPSNKKRKPNAYRHFRFPQRKRKIIS